MSKSREELHEALVHIRYTIDQLVSVLYWSQVEAHLPLEELPKTIFRNACTESSLVSLRILNEFFKAEKTKDRITASHYPGFKSPGPFLSKNELQRLNDHLAHLTWERLDDPSPLWQDAMFDLALVACQQFLQHIVHHFLATTDRDYAPLSQELGAINAFLAWKRRKR
jgi:hypothetical protein